MAGAASRGEGPRIGDGGSPGVPPNVRRCGDCGEAVAGGLRHCPACGRFVPGGSRPLAGIATGAGVAFLLPLVFLMVAGYIWVPVVGLMAEAVIWGYVILTGDLSVSGRRILVGTGIGIVLVAAVAVLMRFCGVAG